MSNIYFIDIETLGLDADRHAIFEIAVVPLDPEEIKRQWLIEPLPNELQAASSDALRLTKFYDRLTGSELRHNGRTKTYDDLTKTYHLYAKDEKRRKEIAYDIAVLLDGHIAGMCVSFDALRLEKWLRQYGSAPQWHYHIVDVEAMAAGCLGWAPPWDSKKLSEELGIVPPQGDECHTALADALWARELYMRVLELQRFSLSSS